MRKLSLSLLTGAGAAVLAVALAAPAAAADTFPKMVRGKTYSVNVLTSFGTTFTDCFRFSETTLYIDGCGDSGPVGEVALSQLSGLTGWRASVPCGGLNLVWIGTSVDGAPLPQGADVVGATAVGLSEGTSFSVNGIGNTSCPSSAVSHGLNYTKGLAIAPKK